MLVAFDYECPIHGTLEIWFNTNKYPNRDFPVDIECTAWLVYGDEEGICGEPMAMLLTTRGMQPDSYWSGKEIKSLGITVNSKDYLKRYCKTNGITQLTDEELKTTKGKNKKQIIQEYLDRPAVVRERQRIISESIDQYGIIDSVNMEK